MRTKSIDNYYDVIYKTKSGRAMVAKRVAAKTDKEARKKVKKEMKTSTSFDSIITTIKL